MRRVRVVVCCWLGGVPSVVGERVVYVVDTGSKRGNLALAKRSYAGAKKDNGALVFCLTGK